LSTKLLSKESYSVLYRTFVDWIILDD